MHSYDIGDVVEVQVVFTDLDGEPIDPDDVSCLVQAPDGTETTTDTGLGNPEVGTWTHEVAVEDSGIWYYRFNGVGGLTAAEEGYFYVTRSVFTATGS